MSERSPLPDIPEYREEILMRLTSKDGVAMEFSRRAEKGSTTPTDSIELRPTGGTTGVSIPLSVISDMGGGDVERGMFVLAANVPQLSYGDTEAGQLDPVYRDVIIPFYGGFDGYLKAA